MRFETNMAPLTEGEKAELLALVGSTELRMDMRNVASSIRNRKVSVDDYVAFATAVARLSNHARPPFRAMTGSCFKL